MRLAYLAPLVRGVNNLGRIVFGPTFEAEVDDDFRIVSRFLNGVTIPFDSLSHGAKERLGVISRFAVGMLVSDEGEVPTIIDDALGYADPKRLEGWSFASARAFHGAFRRAEMQLTGERRGLAWFYDEEVRLNYMSVGELIAEGRRGNQKAIERGLSMARAASNPADYRIFAEMAAAAMSAVKDRTKDDEAKSATEE